MARTKRPVTDPSAYHSPLTEADLAAIKSECRYFQPELGYLGLGMQRHALHLLAEVRRLNAVLREAGVIE